MYIIGENIHIISEKVKEALKNRDREFFMELAVKQVEAGAKAIDINLGPRKKDWEEVFPWIMKRLKQWWMCHSRSTRPTSMAWKLRSRPSRRHNPF